MASLDAAFFRAATLFGPSKPAEVEAARAEIVRSGVEIGAALPAAELALKGLQA